ncbi:hypothetical protein [Burkholderia vietnamiensis]|uniref:hypothetical protein n=1 Tax=Burkholderia vietnamiensis TaxID=60552 RepID=UPI0012D9EB13|nr:hypothetical protein [Burkholderia vietnamiensis]
MFSLAFRGVIVATIWAAQSEFAEHAREMSRKAIFMLASPIARTVETSSSTHFGLLPNAHDMDVNLQNVEGKRIVNAAHHLKAHRVGGQVRRATAGCSSFSASRR